MRVRKLVCFASLAVLGSVLPLVGAHVASTFTKPVLRVDGGAPVPPPIPLPPVPKLS